MKGEEGVGEVMFNVAVTNSKLKKLDTGKALINFAAPSVFATNSSTFSFDQVLTTATRDKSETTKTDLESKTICARKATPTKKKEIKKILRLPKLKPKTRACRSRTAATKRTGQGSCLEGAENM